MSVVDSHCLHAEPHPAFVHHPRAAHRVDQQVAGDHENPRDRGAARRVVLPAPLKRPGKRLRGQMEYDVCPTHTRPEIRDDGADMSFVEAPEIIRVPAPQQGCVLGVSHPHILIYEPATGL